MVAREPFEKRGPGKIREFAPLEVVPAAELRVVRQAALDRPLAQRRRPPDAVRSAAAGHEALDVRGVALNDPPW